MTRAGDTPVPDIETRSDDASSGEMAPLTGVLADRYTLLDLIGTGGMGRVYKARDGVLNRTVAIKLLASGRLGDSASVRFQREAKALSNLRHSGIVSIYDFGSTDSCHPYMVMEYVDGDTLRTVISKNKRLSIRTAIDIMVQLCEAMAHAHAKGIVHRDLKPANMLVSDQDGNHDVRVLDFGVSKILTDTRENQELTHTGQIVGSPYYLSPEQAISGAVDERSDIYAMGCVLFECLTGRVPFSGQSAIETINKHIFADIPTLAETTGRDFPMELESIVATALQKESSARFQSVLEMRDALVNVPIVEKAKPRSPETTDSSDEHHSAKLTKLYTTLALVAVLTVILLIWWLFKFRTVTMTPGSEKLYPSASAIKGIDQPAADLSEEYVKKSDGFTDQMVEKILARKTKVLTINENFSINDERLSKLFRLGQFDTVCLFKSGGSDKAFKEITNQRSLEYLQITRGPITDKGVEYIAKVKSLQRLDLNDCHNITVASLKTLAAKKPDLKVLCIGDTAIRGSDLQILSKFTKLESLDLRHSAKLYDKDLSVLKSLKNLKRLILHENRLLTDGCLPILESLAPHLDWLDISNCENISRESLGRLRKVLPPKARFMKQATEHSMFLDGAEKYFSREDELEF